MGQSGEVDDRGPRFPIRFGRANAILMGALGMGRGRSYVEVDGDAVRVRMGWAFRADVPRSSITEARRERYVWWAYGVHGYRKRWFVNGSGHDIVALALDPLGRGRVLGVPVAIRELWVSVDDPDGLRAAVSA
jgi:hypothetical protein